MKVYRISITSTLLVMAHTEDEAVRIAAENRDDEARLNSVVTQRLAADAVLLAEEPGSLVWHEGDEDVTIEEALARAAAT